MERHVKSVHPTDRTARMTEMADQLLLTSDGGDD